MAVFAVIGVFLMVDILVVVLTVIGLLSGAGRDSLGSCNGSMNSDGRCTA